MASPQEVRACRGAFQAQAIAYLYRALYLVMSPCVVTLTAVNICAQVSLWTCFCFSWSEQCWGFLKSTQTVPESGFAAAEHEGCSLSRPLWCLLWFYQTVEAALVSVQSRALICISLVTDEVEHLCMRLVALCLSSSQKCPFRFFAHFFLWLFVLQEFFICSGYKSLIRAAICSAFSHSVVVFPLS